MRNFKIGDRVALKGTVLDDSIDGTFPVMVEFDQAIDGEGYTLASIRLDTEKGWIRLRPKKKPVFKSDITKGYPTLAFKEIDKYIKNGSESSYGLHFSLDILRKAVEEWESLR